MKLLKIIKYMSIVTLIIGTHHIVFCNSYFAVVRVPVADLLGSPTSEFQKNISPEQFYKELPLCSAGKHPWACCPRLHQLLLGQQVEVVEEKNGQSCIRIPDLFYITAADANPHHQYWTLSSHIAPISALQKKGINLNHLADPISFKTNNIISKKPTITLIAPFKSKTTHQILSAGTRLVYDPTHSTKKEYVAFIFDGKNLAIKKELIPKKYVINNPTDATPEEKIITFLKILRTWAHTSGDTIPYVWGGSSYTHSSADSFERVTKSNCSYFDRPHDSSTPKSGFDCAGLIARAAHSAGIPYFYKNTLTLAQLLASTDHVQDGDLLWICGHVMIVSDRKNNLLIEARGYSHGYGKVHEIALGKVFKGIDTYDQLEKTYHNKTPIVRIDKDGNEQDTSRNYKLLSLRSVWK